MHGSKKLMSLERVKNSNFSSNLNKALSRFRPECPAAAAASKLMCTLLYGARKKPKAAARKEGENLMINLVSYHPWLRIFNFHSSLLLWSKKMRELV
jgi:hypothetical protein